MDFPKVTKTASTPSIFYREGTVFIEGESYPENSFEIYTPVVRWLRALVDEKKDIRIDINISYMNSSSTKCVLDMLDILDEGHQAGVKTGVVWRFDSENPRSRELAEEFKEEFTMPFDIVPGES